MDGPQTSDFCSTPPLTSGRQQRHLAFISEYTNQLKYLPGTSNVVADALLQLPDNLARAPTVFVRWDGHVAPLQPLYDGPYTVIRRSLHHFTLRIGDKVDKVSTLRLKPCTDPTAPPALPRVRDRPPAAVRIRYFPPPGAAAARRVHFAPQQPAEPRREPFSPGTLPGVFARPAAFLDHTAARPARNRRAPPGGSPVEAS